MSRLANKPPAGESWVWLTRELLSSDAWQSQSINTRRFVDFLLIEHMHKGGRENGNLKAPRLQLDAFGIGRRFISEAINDAENLGLVDCNRGGMRVATTYTLTWFTHRDGAPATNRWKNYRNPGLAGYDTSKIVNLGSLCTPGLGAKGNPDGPNLGAKGNPDGPKSLGYKGNHPSRTRSFHGETEQGRREVGAAGGGRA